PRSLLEPLHQTYDPVGLFLYIIGARLGERGSHHGGTPGTPWEELRFSMGSRNSGYRADPVDPITSSNFAPPPSGVSAGTQGLWPRRRAPAPPLQLALTPSRVRVAASDRASREWTAKCERAATKDSSGRSLSLHVLRPQGAAKHKLR